MPSFTKVLLYAGIAFCVPLAALAQPKSDALRPDERRRIK